MKEVTPRKTQLYHESKYIWNAYYLIDLFYHPPIPLLEISYCRWLSELHGKNLSGTHKQQKTGRAEWRGDSKGTTKVNCSLFFFFGRGVEGGDMVFRFLVDCWCWPQYQSLPQSNSFLFHPAVTIMSRNIWTVTDF